jgi:pimeloyl-ACP methyl ester carboxylesterase
MRCFGVKPTQSTLLEHLVKRITVVVLAVLLAVAAGIAGSYGWATRSNAVQTPAAQDLQPDRYAQLSQGAVRYDWAGQQDGPVVVLVHGFSIPRFVFDRNVVALARAGYRVLTYDHLGRRESVRPPGP